MLCRCQSSFCLNFVRRKVSIKSRCKVKQSLDFSGACVLHTQKCKSGKVNDITHVSLLHPRCADHKASAEYQVLFEMLQSLHYVIFTYSNFLSTWKFLHFFFFLIVYRYMHACTTLLCFHTFFYFTHTV